MQPGLDADVSACTSLRFALFWKMYAMYVNSDRLIVTYFKISYYAIEKKSLLVSNRVNSVDRIA